MGKKICPNCAEILITLTEKCPRCGVIPKQSTSPVFIGVALAAGLLVLVLIGLILF